MKTVASLETGHGNASPEMKNGKKRDGIAPANGRGIQSVEVGHRLLVALVDAGRPVILRDLAIGSGLAPAQAHAYLASYRRIGLVVQDPATGEYSLGPLAMRLGLAWMRSYDVLSRTGDAASRLSNTLGLMVCVVVWGPQAPTVIQVQEATRPLHLNIREGTLFSVTGTASGRLFGALSRSDSVARRIAAELKGTAADQGVGTRLQRSELEREFGTIRAKGYATSIGRPIPGINAVSAPVFGHDGNLVAAVTLIGDDQSLPLRESDPTARVLLEEVQGISRPSGQAVAPAGVGVQAERPAKRRARG
jgi:DNA-binding IclR family transcriptional regulator